jgi:hypothetical protein
VSLNERALNELEFISKFPGVETYSAFPTVPPKPVAVITVVHHRRAFIALGCNSEEESCVAPKRIHGSGVVKTEKVD